MLFPLQVANKLYPLSSIAQQIEDFAKEMMLSIVNSDATESMDGEGSVTGSQKVLILCTIDLKVSLVANPIM